MIGAGQVSVGLCNFWKQVFEKCQIEENNIMFGALVQHDIRVYVKRQHKKNLCQALRGIFHLGKVWPSSNLFTSDRALLKPS